MTEVMRSPEEKSEGPEAEPGLDCRLAQIEGAIAAAKKWIEENEAEIQVERLMSSGDAWEARYNRVQEFAMEETRKSIERLEAERDAIVAEDEEFKAWCKQRYGKKDSE